MRTFDIWTHEQDIRSAIGRPGNLDSPAAAVFVQQALARLPRVVARDAKVEPGHTVILALTGPIMAKVGVRVDEGEDGRPLGHAMFTGESVDASTPHVEGPITSVSLSTDAFTRRAAGRRSVDDTTYTLHSGDEAVARRVLDAWSSRTDAGRAPPGRCCAPRPAGAGSPSRRAPPQRPGPRPPACCAETTVDGLEMAGFGGLTATSDRDRCTGPVVCLHYTTIF